jgi:carboxypeptidase T
MSADRVTAAFWFQVHHARTMSIRNRLVLAASLVIGLLTATTGAAAAAPSFPPGDEAYHTYAELTTELHDIVAAHPEIARFAPFGKSYLGREIWMLKISDNVNTDETEPEVLITGLTHAREHLTVEQSLAIIHWLVNGYGNVQRITDIVNSTELWIVPMLNPDGGEYDIHGGHYHSWRKNRQPTPGSPAIGTDINRNFGYRWGCCGGSSSNPYAITYRGPSPFSTPEATAERDFVNSRVIDEKQQIKLAVSFHSFGEEILFPYGYTTTRLPSDMVPNDRKAMKALATGIGARNGYHPMQESHLYITDGTFLDWDYGHAGVLTFTIELAPRTTSEGGFYPAGSRVASMTAHNKNALLWFIEQAQCPYDAAGITQACSTPPAGIGLVAAQVRVDWTRPWVGRASPPVAS